MRVGGFRGLRLRVLGFEGLGGLGFCVWGRAAGDPGPTSKVLKLTGSLESFLVPAPLLRASRVTVI